MIFFSDSKRSLLCTFFLLDYTFNFIDKLLVIKLVRRLVESFYKFKLGFASGSVELLQRECKELGVLSIDHAWFVGNLAFHQYDAFGLCEFWEMGDGKERSSFASLGFVFQKRSKMALMEIELHKEELYAGFTWHGYDKLIC